MDFLERGQCHLSHNDRPGSTLVGRIYTNAQMINNMLKSDMYSGAGVVAAPRMCWERGWRIFSDSAGVLIVEVEDALHWISYCRTLQAFVALWYCVAIVGNQTRRP